MTEDNAFKRALIPALKLMTRAINGYTNWAAAHRRASHIIIVVIFVLVTMTVGMAIVAFVMTPAGFIIMLSLLWLAMMGKWLELTRKDNEKRK